MSDRNFSRDDIRIRKVDRVNEINTNRINKRKYYGVGVEKEQYEESLDFHVNHTAVVKAFDDNIANVNTESYESREALVDDVVSAADFLREGVDDVVNDVAEPVRNSFEKGTRRAFDSTGDTLPAPDDIGERVAGLVDEQRNYVSKLVSDLRSKAREIVRNGLGGDKSGSEIKEELNSELKNLKDNRSETIAETETVKASQQGVEETFEENGIKKVEWVAEIDEKTCDAGTFDVTYNGTRYTSCRQLDGEVFDRTGNYPTPPQHPYDRCVVVAVE